jgi:NADH:ubiquinone oxidoreductase subunit 4 (subunit M)
MPIFSFFFLLFTLGNLSLPGTSSFVGEFLLLTGIYKVNILASVISALGVILCGIYSLWLYNRIIFGNLKINHTLLFKDITFRELSILFPLLVLVFLMGIYPTFFLNFIHISSSNLFLITS